MLWRDVLSGELECGIVGFRLSAVGLLAGTGEVVQEENGAGQPVVGGGEKKGQAPIRRRRLVSQSLGFVAVVPVDVQTSLADGTTNGLR